jgi:Holliday junction DNA helicase RuvB
MFDIEDKIRIDTDEADTRIDRALRPQSFNDYVGQKDLIERLRISIQASNERNDPLGHILLTGPPGLGKTSVANVIANECATKFKSIVALSIKTQGDLLETLTQLEPKSILFIDEIHRII